MNDVPLRSSGLFLLLVFSFSFCFTNIILAAESEDYNVASHFLDGYRAYSFVNMDAHTGAAIYDYPLATPPGRNGIQPELTLSYNSNTKENANVFGYGWDISIPSITRVNKNGINNLYSEDNYLSSLDGELTLISDVNGVQTYGARFESGSFNEYVFENDSWEMTTKNGVIHNFGTATTSQIYNIASSTQIYGWLVDNVKDTNDNYMEYEYYQDDGQIYPSKITYTGNDITDGPFEVEFLRESRTDAITSYKTGYAITSNYRIDEIQVKIDSSWVRKYELNYITGDNGVRSMLGTITETGKDEENNTIILPATTMTYQKSNISFTEDSNWETSFIDSELGPAAGVRIADINGDGLVDIVRGQAIGYDYTCISSCDLNTGSGWNTNGGPALPEDACFLKEYTPNANDFGLRLGDVDGDGLMDLFHAYDTDYPNNTETENKQFKKIFISSGSAFTEHASSTEDIADGFYFSNWYGGSDPVKMLFDVNNDGLVDIVRSSYADLAVDGIGGGWTRNTDMGHKIQATDPRLGDFNGDGLTDSFESYYYTISSVSYSNKEININTGNDFVGSSASSTIPAYFSDEHQDMGYRLVDFNGDGLTDIVHAFNNQSNQLTQTVYINTGTGFSSYTTTFPSDDAYFTAWQSGGNKDRGWRLFDVNGDMMPDWIGTYYDNTSVDDSKAYINNGKKADLLSTVTTS